MFNILCRVRGVPYGVSSVHACTWGRFLLAGGASVKRTTCMHACDLRHLRTEVACMHARHNSPPVGLFFLPTLQFPSDSFPALSPALHPLSVAPPPPLSPPLLRLATVTLPSQCRSRSSSASLLSCSFAHCCLPHSPPCRRVPSPRFRRGSFASLPTWSFASLPSRSLSAPPPPPTLYLTDWGISEFFYCPTRCWRPNRTCPMSARSPSMMEDPNLRTTLASEAAKQRSRRLRWVRRTPPPRCP